MAYLEYMSNSRLLVFLQCPEKYNLSYVQGFKQPKNSALMQGISYHEAVAKDLKHLKDNGCLMEEDELFEAFGAAFDKEAETTEDWQGGIPGRVKDNTWIMTRKYHREQAPNIYPYEVEERKEVIIGGYKFVFICDIIAKYGKESKRIIDHKLKKRQFTANDIRKNLQATGYSMATGIPRVEFHQAVKTRHPEIIVTPTLRGSNDYAMYEHIVSGIGRSIEAGIFYPNPTGNFCTSKWCHCYDICRGRSLQVPVEVEIKDLVDGIEGSLPREEVVEEAQKRLFVYDDERIKF